jgi:7-alpha-hydroxysteroid dehydrogenase
MTSVGAYRATRGNLAHHTAKAALAQLTRLMAADLGPKVRVNALVPAAIETPGLREVFDRRPDLREMVTAHTRLRRIGTPEDVAYAAVYLASPAASWITGTLLDITGGVVDEIKEVAPDL